MVGKQSTNYLHLSSILPFSEAKTISYILKAKKSQNSAFQSKKICAIVQCSKLLSSHNHQHLWCCLFKVDNIGEVD